MSDRPQTVDELERPDGNDLQSNYQHHDTAEYEFLSLLPPEVGVEWYGIDQRDDDSGELTYDDKPDFKLWKHGKLVALVDVKAKTNPEYLGLFNERHYHKYIDKYEEYDVPLYVYMTHTEGDERFVSQLDGSDDEVYLTSREQFMLTFPDHNNACYVKPDTRMCVQEFIDQL